MFITWEQYRHCLCNYRRSQKFNNLSPQKTFPFPLTASSYFRHFSGARTWFSPKASTVCYNTLRGRWRNNCQWCRWLRSLSSSSSTVYTTNVQSREAYEKYPVEPPISITTLQTKHYLYFSPPLFCFLFVQSGEKKQKEMLPNTQRIHTQGHEYFFRKRTSSIYISWTTWPITYVCIGGCDHSISDKNYSITTT